MKETGQKQRKRRAMRRTGVFALAALLSIAAASIASTAYWTDQIETEAAVGSLDIGIAYGSGGVHLEDAEAFLPGEQSAFSFVVKNNGKVSADVKPVIRIRASKEMRRGASEYLIADADGNRAEEAFEITYLKEDAEVKNPEQEAFDTVVYTAKTFSTLAGSVQADESLDRDASSGGLITEKEYLYYLRLGEYAENAFMGAAADLEVSTYAIQHRNSEDVRKDGSWIQELQETKGL